MKTERKCWSGSTTTHISPTPRSSIPSAEAAREMGVKVQQWIGNNFHPEQWRWKSTRKGLIPVTTLKSPAPEKLLQLISYKCKDCWGSCECRRTGCFCSKLCLLCEGTCSNNDDRFDLEDGGDKDEPPVTIPPSEEAEVTEDTNSYNISQYY
ncbi:hypothetical protein PR048_019963 [Dryococelus australis]|uniref:ARF7 effector protein C-terminal domain-containing protein n=1 Tax=Dryococelus australis TaxID=614101 RepID=A0ABQ9H531_9NEOP|nr:hypothetical protein PR048_019963 [Dryococelus australis]